jgi:hypothetical protein
MKKPDKPDKLTLFVFFTTLIFATPLFALLSAAIYAKVWDMVLAAQYGEGPTYQSWYGISVLTTFVTMNLQKRDKPGDDDTGIIARTIGGIVGAYAGMGVVLLLVMFVCFALGWSR